jgi:hypothetical protein
MSEIKILTRENYQSGFEACEANIGEARFCTDLSYHWEEEVTQGIVICVKMHGRCRWARWDYLSKAAKSRHSDKLEIAFCDHLIASSNYDDEKHALRAQLAKKRCAIPGCPGMCARDFDEYNPEGFEVCFCCKKKQSLECPICYESHKTNNMVCGSNCTHHICWKCYGMAHRGGNGIENCPMCRAAF